MAYLFDVNGEPSAHGSAAMFRVKTLLKSAGWTVPRSSDGTTYNSSGDQITHSESGAGGMDNNRAWFVVRQPGTNAREFCFQRDTSAALTTAPNWRVKYSGGPSTGFTGGTPSATQVPSATDEQVVFSGGTDATPSFTSFFFSGLYSCRLNIIAGGQAEGYPFLFWSSDPNVSATAGSNTGFGLDIMMPGTYDPTDIDPAVVYPGSSNNIGNFGSELFAPTQPKAWFNKGDANAAFQSVALLSSALNGTVTTNTLRSSFATGKDDLGLVQWARNPASGHPGGVKGVSTIFRVPNMARGYGIPFSFANSTARDWVSMGGTGGCFIAVPWNGSRALLLR